MRVSQRLDYAVRAAVELADLPAGHYEAGAEIARRLGLPARFVEQQLSALGKHGLVACRRGSGGGCALARPAEEITVGELVTALEGGYLDVPRVTGSSVSGLWKVLGDAVREVLDSVTLADLAREQRIIEAARAPMYYI
jgi:Rrf2 family protein